MGFENGHGNHVEVTQQLLSGDTSAESISDSSRISPASHSRNSSTGIPNNPALPTTSITISPDVARQQVKTGPMTTDVSTFMPIPKIHKQLNDSRSEVVLKQNLL